MEDLEINDYVVKGNEDLRNGVKTYFIKLYPEDF